MWQHYLLLLIRWSIPRQDSKRVCIGCQKRKTLNVYLFIQSDPQLHVRIHRFFNKVCPCPGLWEEVHDGEGLAPGAALGTPVLLGPAWEQSRGLGLH